MWCNEWQVIAFAGHTNFHMGRAEQGNNQIYFRFDKLSKIRDKNQWMMFDKLYETYIIWMILSFKQKEHFIWLRQVSFECWKHNLNQYRTITIIMIYKTFQFHHFIWASKNLKLIETSSLPATRGGGYMTWK